MINAVHMLLYSRDPAADRAFFRDVLGWPYVEDTGTEPGWLIFKTPPAEVGVHPTDGSEFTEMHLMRDDIQATAADLAARGVPGTEGNDRGYGLVVTATLPGGGQIGLYEPRHKTAYQL